MLEHEKHLMMLHCVGATSDDINFADEQYDAIISYDEREGVQDVVATVQLSDNKSIAITFNELKRILKRMQQLDDNLNS